MNADTSTFTYDATTGSGNLWTETDTASNTGTGFLHAIGTAASSAAGGLELFATGSSGGTFTNSTAFEIENLTSATSGQNQPSPSSSLCGNIWNGANSLDCETWQLTYGTGTNPTYTLSAAHLGTTGNGTLSLPFKAVNFLTGGAGTTFSTGDWVINSTSMGASSFSTNLTISGGANAAGSTGGLTLQSGDQTGTGANTSGSTLLRGGNDASTSATSLAGNAIVEAGQATAGGKQGQVQIFHTYYVSAALSNAHEAVCGTTTAWYVAACTAAANNVVGEAETVGGTNTAILVGVQGGEYTLIFDGTPILGDVVCYPPSAGTTGEFHDNGTTACTLGESAGTVVANVSGSGAGATATVDMTR